MAKSLMIDPGHGGSDPGASGFGVKEKDWTLKMSMYQYNRLKQLGANVGITRTTDKTLDSVARTNLIKNKYDYCMSNHFNSFNGTARGVEAIHSIHSSDAVAKRLANIIVQTSKLPYRRVFDRAGSNGDYYFMHRLTGSTATVIVEYGFIDHELDNKYYKNDVQFYRVAEAVVKEWCGILGVKYVANNSGTAVSKPTGNTFTVTGSLGGYVTAADAKNGKNRKTTVKPGTYYIYNRSDGMVNVTTKQGVPGSWINPVANQQTKGDQQTTSIVDYLKSIKVDASFSHRKKLATQYGIKNYTGTAQQNMQLLNMLRGK